jgi:MFS family permease
MGPGLGGFIVTVAPWRWIFFLSVPFALLGAALAMRFIDDDRQDLDRGPAPALDTLGLLLLALGFGALLGGIETAGKGMVAPWVTALMVLGGAACLALYLRHSRRAAEPALDLALLRFRAFRLCLLGGVPVRIALGAAPFLLPLMLQLGFGLSALESGLLTMALALGALSARPALSWAIQTFGFRPLLIGASVLAACFYAAYGLFRPGTPQPLMFAVLFLGGLCTSVIMVTLNTVGYAQIPRASSGHASALASMVQQLSMAVGVVLGAGTVSLSSHLRGAAGAPGSPDFTVAFLMLAALALGSATAFRRFRSEDGQELRPPPRREG